MNKNFRHGNPAALMNQETLQNPASQMGYQSKPKRRAMSSEPPKKIWFDKDYLTVGFEPIDDRDIPYIRADIVDELVGALKEAVHLSDDPVEFFEWRDSAMVALAKLEESHEV